MALPLSGIITSSMILTELGITGSGNIIYNIIQKVGGVLQVKVNSGWVNLNMCSPYLPSEVPAYIIATDWYGYDHGVTGVEILNIAGDTTIDVGQVVTYTASMTGDNLTGVVLTWSKFEAGAWTDNITTGTTLTVTWADPRDAKIRVIASNICNLNIVKKEIDITYNCTTITGDPYVGGTFAVNQTFDVWAVNAFGVVGTPSNTRLGITFFWEVTGSVQIVSGQGTNKVVLKPTAVSSNLNIRVTIGSCGGTSTSSYVTFSSADPIEYYYNTAQSASIQKQCASGQIGSYVTVTRAANTHSSTVSVADANDQAIAWLGTQDAQNIANATGNCGDTPTYGNERRTQSFIKYCVTGVGTRVEYVVQENTYFASSVGAANTLAQNEIDANGQNKANSEGQCIVGCEDLVYSCSITPSSYSFSGGSISGTYSANVSRAGYYTVQIYFTASYRTSFSVYLQQGNNTGISFSLAAIGNYQLQLGVNSPCSAATDITSSSVNVTGSVACTNGVIESGTTRAAYFNGTYTMAMGFTNHENVRNVAGYIELVDISTIAIKQTNYFSGLDFSGGNTVYQTFGIPSGQHWYVYFRLVITSGDGLCDPTQEYLSYGTVEIINPS